MGDPPRVVDVILGVVPIIIVAGLVVFARWFDARRSAAKTFRQLPRETIIQQSVDKVASEFADRVPILKTEVSQSPRGPANDRDQLWIFFLVDREFESSPACDEMRPLIDARMRQELLLSGYFRNDEQSG